MKIKKGLSFILTLALVLALIPGNAFSVYATDIHDHEGVIDQNENADTRGIPANEYGTDVFGEEYVLIQFDGNGGTSISSIQTIPNQMVSLPSEIPDRSGYHFAGWSRSKAGDAEIAPGEGITVGDSVVLYAQWNKICTTCKGDGVEDYSLKCSYCSGKGSVSSSSYCSSCGGDGKVASSVKCTSCSGTGKGSVYNATCNWCAGYGGYFTYRCSSGHTTTSKYRKYSCSVCGSYSVSETIHKCSTCGGYGTVKSDKCKACDGAGSTSVQNSSTCYSCSGSGYAKVDCSRCVGGYNSQTRSCDACGATGEVIRSSVSAPDAPTVQSIGPNAVTLNAITNGEYSIDGITWQESPVFENLETGKEYSFYQRYAKTDTTSRSEASLALKMSAHEHWYDNACDAQCNTCSAVRTVPDHVYDHQCDAACNICGSVRAITHTYEWVVDQENNCGVDGSRHEECSVCHAVQNVGTVIPATGNHVYDNTCDTVCNICSSIRTITHTYDHDCDTVCKICGHTRTITHTYDNKCDTTCNVCGDDRTVPDHVYDHVCDTTCNECGDTRTVPHAYDDDRATNCNLCGYDRTQASGQTGSCSWYVVDTRLYISGNGDMAGYSGNGPWGREITKVVIDDGVTSIGKYAFGNCANLVSVTLPASITSIGDDAFCYCESLENITLHEGITGIGQYAFYGCSSLTAVTIPDSVTALYSYAFYNCTSLREITIGEGVTAIGQRVFYNCTGLESVTFNAKMCTTIQSNAFEKCSNVKTITIGENVMRLLDSAFNAFVNLETVYYNAISFSTSNSYYYKTFVGKSSIKTVSIGPKVTYLPDYLFKDCVGIETVYYLASNIYDAGIFVGCGNIKTAYIGETVKRIPSYLFRDCAKLESITIPANVKSIDSYAFGGCVGLKTVTLEEGVNNIFSYAFYGCSNLEEIALPNSVTQICEFAFAGCTKLKTVVTGNGLETIGSYAFEDCQALERITLAKELTTINSYAFYGCSSLTDVYYDSTLWRREDIDIYSGNQTLLSAQWHCKTQLAAPVLKGTNDSSGRAKLTWTAVPEADAYRIFCGDHYGYRYFELTTTTQLQYVDNFSYVGDIYVYLVVAIDLDDDTRDSDYSNEVDILTKCAAPKLTVKTGSAGKPVLSWNKVSSAKKYEIWRSVDGGAFKKLTTTTKLTYTDSKATTGSKCTYKIKTLGSSSGYDSIYSATGSCYITCAAPSLTVKADSKTGYPYLSWKKVTGAKSYAIYRSVNGGEYQQLTTTTAVSYQDKSAAPDNKYSYYVVTLGKEAALNSIPSSAKSITLAVKAPKLSGSANANGKPVISWAAVENAVSYKVYRSTKSGSGYTLVKTTTDRSYTDTSVATGKTFYYKVVAVGANTESAQSASLKMVGKCATPATQVVLDEDSGKPVISWSKIEGAKKYTVYRATSENGKYSKLGTSTKLTYTDTKATVGTRYFYKIVANPSSSSANSNYSNIESCLSICAKAVVTVKVDAATGKPTLSWKKVTGAKTYQIYRSENGGAYVLVATQTAVSYKDTTAVAGNAYSYQVKVIASKTGADSLPSAEKTATATLAQPKLTGKVGTTGKPALTWNAVEGATKYVIYRSTSKSKGYTVLTETEDLTYTDATAVKGKTYYYKIVAVCGDTQSAESAVVKVKSK